MRIRHNRVAYRYSSVAVHGPVVTRHGSSRCSSRPLFSSCYKSLFMQLLSFHNHTKPPGVWGAPSLQNATEACSAEQTLFSQQLAHSLSLLSFFFRTLSSIFSNLSTLRQEYRVGTPLAVLSLLGANRQIFFRRVILFLGIAAREA